MRRDKDERPELRVKRRPQITTDRDTYELARVLAREDGGSVSNLVRTLIRKSALGYFGVATVREALTQARKLGALETRGGGA